MGSRPATFIFKGVTLFHPPNDKDYLVGKGCAGEALLYRDPEYPHHEKVLKQSLKPKKNMKNEAIFYQEMYGEVNHYPSNETTIESIVIPRFVAIPLGEAWQNCAKSNDPKKVLNMIFYTFESLYQMHQKNIYHGDLHLFNILVSTDPAIPDVYIIDFGLSKSLELDRVGDDIRIAGSEFDTFLKNNNFFPECISSALKMIFLRMNDAESCNKPSLEEIGDFFKHLHAHYDKVVVLNDQNYHRILPHFKNATNNPFFFLAVLAKLSPKEKLTLLKKMDLDVLKDRLTYCSDGYLFESIFKELQTNKFRKQFLKYLGSYFIKSLQSKGILKDLEILLAKYINMKDCIDFLGDPSELPFKKIPFSQKLADNKFFCQGKEEGFFSIRYAILKSKKLTQHSSKNSMTHLRLSPFLTYVNQGKPKDRNFGRAHSLEGSFWVKERSLAGFT